MYGLEAYSTDQVGHLDSGVATFDRSYAATPDELTEQLKVDPAIGIQGKSVDHQQFRQICGT